MADWKDTLNLPRTDFPDEGEPDRGGAAGARAMEGDAGCTEQIQERARAAVRSSSCTTARRTRTATSISARR